MFLLALLAAETARAGVYVRETPPLNTSSVPIVLKHNGSASIDIAVGYVFHAS